MHQSLSLDTGPASKQSTHQQANMTQEAFVWTKHWYPLSLEADLDTQNPTPHTLLNIDMVIWKDGQGKWGACEDRCPHRSAATALPDFCMFGTKTAHHDFATSWQAAKHVCHQQNLKVTGNCSPWCTQVATLCSCPIAHQSRASVMHPLDADCCQVKSLLISMGPPSIKPLVHRMGLRLWLTDRLAPLSEGRIQNGNLACNYHGWEFDRKGACLANPQVGPLLPCCSLHWLRMLDCMRLDHPMA